MKQIEQQVKNVVSNTSFSPPMFMESPTSSHPKSTQKNQKHQHPIDFILQYTLEPTRVKIPKIPKIKEIFPRSRFPSLKQMPIPN